MAFNLYLCNRPDDGVQARSLLSRGLWVRCHRLLGSAFDKPWCFHTASKHI